MRILKSANEVIDLISQMKGGAKVAVGYISSARLPQTVSNIDKTVKDNDGNDVDGWGEVEKNKGDFDDNTYNSLTKLKGLGRKGKYSDIGIKGIVKLSQFTTNWQTTQNFKKNAANVERAREDFFKDHGVSQDAIDDRRRGSYNQEQEYGKNGIMVGKSDPSKIHFYLNPVTNTNAKYQYYIIDDKGDMSRPISKNAVMSLLRTKAREAPLISVLDTLENSEEIKQEYREWCKALKYNYNQYSLDNVLYLTGTVDGEKFFFFNNKLTKQIDTKNKDLLINPQAFLKVAKEHADKLSVDMSWADELPESKRRKNKVVLKENALRHIIKETIKKVIKERYL